MSFQLSSEVDSNKIFLIKRSELEGRLDAKTYHPNRTYAIQRIVNSKYKYQKLGFIADFSKKTTNIVSSSDIYVGLENIESNTGMFIKNDKKESISSASIFTKGQVLFPKLRPYLNKVFYASFSGICSTEFHVLESFSVTNKFLAYFLSLDVVVTQTSLLMSGNTLPRLQTEDIKNFLIPIPPKQIQSKIIAKMDTAYTAKKQKEAEAHKLLDSIDDYLLGELGIELPEQEDNTIQSRMFTRRLSEVSGGRFDPFFSSLNKQDKSGKYSFYNLKELAQIRKGNSITSDDVVDGLIPVIAGGQTSPYNHNVANNDGDIITVSASGYAGYVWYHPKPVFASDCTMISSKNTAECTTKYIFEYLKTQQQEIYNLRSGAIQPHVYPSDLEKIKIPVPPLEKQIEIVNHITKIRDKVKALQQQAKADLEQAKKEVETMILGEDENMA